jgi:GTP 3',8-cyclase
MVSLPVVQNQMPGDMLGREVKDLRISVTDRCNFRCTYCMPFERYEWMDRREILSFEEIVRIATVFVRLGVDKIRLTGGEPLLRRDLSVLVSKLSLLQGPLDLCLTTNGALLAKAAPELARAGLKRVNVSLDTLDETRFRRLAGRPGLAKVLEGLFAARDCGLTPIKINAVIQRGVNDDEIVDLAEFARGNGFSIRFIEFMDVGNANDWAAEKIVPKTEILEKIKARIPLLDAVAERGSAPAVNYRFADGNGDVGVIASVSEPFCGGCTRIRITADGKLVTCLFSDHGENLKSLLRGGADDQELLQFISSVWERRADRYSEQRSEILKAGNAAASRKKIEMIRLGG